MNKIIFLIIAIVFSTTSSYALLRDTFIEESLQGKELEVPYTNVNYNYESIEKIPIELNITDTITTKKDQIYDGQILYFKVKKNVVHKNGFFIKKDTLVKARVETYVSRGMNGLPATIVIDNFEIENVPQEKLKGTAIYRGLNLALIVFPVKWVLTPIPGAGSCTNFIVGGHAKLTKRKTIKIYYYPNWGKKEEKNSEITKIQKETI